jgi:serine/threonine-protein kinase RsbW
MDNQFSLSGPATQNGVRDLLSRGRARLAEAGVPEACLGTVELVWAEALNNIAEHAYAGTVAGQVHMEVKVEGPLVSATIRDCGNPLPDFALPPGRLPDSSGPVESLPEGGFGWFLIRDLCDSVAYWHENGENHLSLVLKSEEHTA